MQVTAQKLFLNKIDKYKNKLDSQKQFQVTLQTVNTVSLFYNYAYQSAYWVIALENICS